MRKIKTIVCIILSVLAIITPILSPFAVAALVPSQYSETFVGILDEKVERLRSIDGPKAVVIGGSSVAFGIDSALMEEYLGMPVVNFGLYAAIGTRAMMELSRSSIGNGDIIILAPELDRQTLSMYFSADPTLKAIDGDYSLSLEFPEELKLSLIGGIWRHSYEKLADSADGPDSPDGVYNSKNFNEYGDVVWERKENVMPLYYDPATEIDLTSDIFEAEFIEYVNEYISFCESRGATVYFSYAPMNSLAVKDSSAVALSEFDSFVRESLDCEVISFIDSYVIEPGYFWDTNYHLNDAGVIYRTKTLIEDILLTRVDITVPEAPPLPEADVRFDGEDANAKYFVYEKMENGALMIAGLSELGKAQNSLTVPLGADGYKITAIGADAFGGGVAKELIVTENTNLRNFLDNFIRGSSITDIKIYYDFTDENEKLAPASDFGGVTIHIPKGSIYPNHYDWNDSSGGFTFAEDLD